MLAAGQEGRISGGISGRKTWSPALSSPALWPPLLRLCCSSSSIDDARARWRVNGWTDQPRERPRSVRRRYLTCAAAAEAGKRLPDAFPFLPRPRVSPLGWADWLTDRPAARRVAHGACLAVEPLPPRTIENLEVSPTQSNKESRGRGADAPPNKRTREIRAGRDRLHSSLSRVAAHEPAVSVGGTKNLSRWSRADRLAFTMLVSQGSEQHSRRPHSHPLTGKQRPKPSNPMQSNAVKSRLERVCRG